MKKALLAGLVLLSLALGKVFAAADAADTAVVETQDSVSVASEADKADSDLEKLREIRLMMGNGEDNGGGAFWVSSMFISAMPFLFALVVILAVLYFRNKRNKDMQALYMKYLETGKDIPAELLSPKPRKSELQRGITMTAIGIGIMAFMFILTGGIEGKVWAVGLIPFCIGLGYMVIHLLNKKKN